MTVTKLMLARINNNQNHAWSANAMIANRVKSCHQKQPRISAPAFEWCESLQKQNGSPVVMYN